MRASLLSAVEIVDQQPIVADIEIELERALRLVAPPGKARLAREMLEGWWWPRICAALSASTVQSIPLGLIEAKLDDIRDALKRDALVAEFDHVEPSANELDQYDAFVMFGSCRSSALAAIGLAMRNVTSTVPLSSDQSGPVSMSSWMRN
jgi:hypothetical protein